MEIEDEISRHAETYGVDIDLAWAVCLYESGGNANLNSWAGAQGYFQVMPATFRSLRVDTNIEAGVKYLSQMIGRFDREDYALAAYNGGPGRVSRGRPPLESLQYVLGVGHYRSVLKLHARSIRHHARQMSLVDVREGDDWWSISQRTGIPIRSPCRADHFPLSRRGCPADLVRLATMSRVWPVQGSSEAQPSGAPHRQGSLFQARDYRKHGGWSATPASSRHPAPGEQRGGAERSTTLSIGNECQPTSVPQPNLSHKGWF